MKRGFLIILLSVFLVMALSFTVLAAEEEGEERKNIAADATITTTSSCWVVAGQQIGDWRVTLPKLVDGNHGTGVGSSFKEYSYGIWFEYSEGVRIDTISVWVNQVAEYDTAVSEDENLTLGVSGVNLDFDFYVCLYDKNKKKIFQQCYNTFDQKEIVVEPNLQSELIYYVEYWNESKYSAGNVIWEIEIWEHKCKLENLIETIEPETCVGEGLGVYKCTECGTEEEDIIPPKGYHSYDNIHVEYENGYLKPGSEVRGCLTCEREKNYYVDPLFKFEGYSVSISGTGLCASFIVNRDAVEKYESSKNVKFSYGLIFSTDESTTPLNGGEALLTPAKGMMMSLTNESISRFDIRIVSSNWTQISDYELSLCGYIIENDKIYYVCNDDAVMESVAKISYGRVANQGLITQKE